MVSKDGSTSVQYVARNHGTIRNCFDIKNGSKLGGDFFSVWCWYLGREEECRNFDLSLELNELRIVP